MQGQSKVALVIVNYNGGPTVIKCLEAVSRQTLSPHRIIVVDNASDDNSPIRIKKEFPKVEIISNKLNLGFSAANNIAVKEAHDCSWVALLNQDAFPEVLTKFFTLRRRGFISTGGVSQGGGIYGMDLC